MKQRIMARRTWSTALTAVAPCAVRLAAGSSTFASSSRSSSSRSSFEEHPHHLVPSLSTAPHCGERYESGERHHYLEEHPYRGVRLELQPGLAVGLDDADAASVMVDAQTRAAEE